jgi:hypothetical protein
MVIARNSGLAIHHVTVHDLGGKLTVSIDLEVDGEMPLTSAHDIAHEAAAAWTATDLADKPTIAGPGFLNFTTTLKALTARAQAIADDPRAGALEVEHKRRVVYETGHNVSATRADQRDAELAR